MVEKFVEISTSFIANRLNCDEDTYDKLKYGFSIIYLNLFKTALLIIASLILGIFNYVILFIICYSVLRFFAAGVHADSDLLCTAIALTSVIGFVYIAIYITLNYYIYLLLFFLCFITYYLFAPAQTKKKPISKKRIKPLKTKSLITVLALFAISFFIEEGAWRNLLVYSVILEAINILPQTYKLLERR